MHKTCFLTYKLVRETTTINPNVNLTNEHKFLKCENMWFTIDLKGCKVCQNRGKIPYGPIIIYIHYFTCIRSPMNVEHIRTQSN